MPRAGVPSRRTKCPGQPCQLYDGREHWRVQHQQRRERPAADETHQHDQVVANVAESMASRPLANQQCQRPRQKRRVESRAEPRRGPCVCPWSMGARPSRWAAAALEAAADTDTGNEGYAVRPRVVIVGGGIGGLTAAVALEGGSVSNSSPADLPQSCCGFPFSQAQLLGSVATPTVCTLRTGDAQRG